MNHRCAEPMELAALYGLPDDDPRRRDAAACPRCDSLLRAMAAFSEGNPDLPAGERLAAEKHLAGALAAVVVGAPQPGVGGADVRRGRAAPGRTDVRDRRRHSWTWGLGLAAAAAGVMLVVSREPMAPAGPSGVLRGGTPAESAAPVLPVTASSGPGPDRFSLSWPAVAGAESYRLELFTSELDTVAVFEALISPEVTVAASLLAGPGQGGTAAADILCRVRVRGAGGQTAAAPLTVLGFSR